MHWIWRNFIISTLLAIGVFYFIFFSETGNWPHYKDLWLEFLIVIILVNSGGAFLFFINRKLNKFIPWNKNISIRFLSETTSGVFVFGFLSFVFIYAYIMQIVPVEENVSFWSEYWDGVVKFGILSIVIIYIYSIVNFSVFSYSQYAYVQIEKLSVEREQIKLQFDALKSQLSPHFLFNALNTISSLIYKDIYTSEDYIRKLSKTYQYILETNNQKLVSLSEELEMVKAFYYMQRIKYEDYIELELNISPIVLNSKIPPLTIQMLLENTLKHNLISDKEVLKISVFNEGNKYILIRNNLIQKPELLKIGNSLVDRPHEQISHKIGLKNIKQRYKYFANRGVEIIIDEYFTVKLPVMSEISE